MKQDKEMELRVVVVSSTNLTSALTDIFSKEATFEQKDLSYVKR